MLILSRVCADFHDRNGSVIHRVTPQNRLVFHEAPEAIRSDPLFRLLTEEGALEAAPAPVKQKQLEADPLEGTDPAGRRKASAETAERKRASLKKTADEALVRTEQNN